MLVREIFDYCITESGAFIIAESDLEIDITKFTKMLKVALGYYNRYMPREGRFNIDVSNSREYTFTSDIPKWISDCVPVRISGLPYFMRDALGWQNDLEKQNFLFTYETPKLTVMYAGQFDIHAVYDHELTVNDTTLSTIDYKDYLFLDMMLGYFLLGLGRSRRAFTLNDMPITTDADLLVSEGQEKLAEAKDKVEELSKGFLAW